MYKIANDKAVAGAARLRLPDLARAGLPELQTDEQKRRNLVRALKAVEAQIVATEDRGLRKKLGLQKFDLQNQIREIRPKGKTDQSLGDHFIDAARELLTRADFMRLMDDASARWKAKQRLAGNP